jgi:sec-independent protein translocase protein TatA
MGSFSIWHWMLFLAVALLLFGGKGKISDIMGDVAKGMRSFKKGMSDDETTDAKADAPARSLENRAARPRGPPLSFGPPLTCSISTPANSS